MDQKAAMREAVTIRRAAGLIGVELMEVENTQRDWKILNPGYGMALPVTWEGEALYRNRRVSVTPGMAFCTDPGEIHRTPRVWTPGAFNVLVLDADVFRSHIAEVVRSEHEPRWRVIAGQCSPRLLGCVATLFRAMRDDRSPLEVQSALMEVVAGAAGELVEGKAARGESPDALARAAERMRECLHSSEGEHVDLNGLAAVLGVNRYQALRAFKRRYGVPPHAYQLSVKIARARWLLGEGQTIARIAADCGFSDQSHFTRHFKRALGITPSQYAGPRGQRGGRGPLVGVALCPEADLVARGDRPSR
jgi:AraC-like DNA-binding protein